MKLITVAHYQLRMTQDHVSKVKITDIFRKCTLMVKVWPNTSRRFTVEENIV